MSMVLASLLSRFRKIYNSVSNRLSKRNSSRRESATRHDQEDHGTGFVIVNGQVFSISDDGKGGIFINNNNGEILHHDDGNGNVTIFVDPVAGSSTVVPINYDSHLHDVANYTGTTASNESSRCNSGTFDSYRSNSGITRNRSNSGNGTPELPRSAGGGSRRNSGVGIGSGSRRNSGVGLGGGSNSRRNSNVELYESSMLEINRRNSRDIIPVHIPQVLSITSRSRRNSRDSVIEAEAHAVQSDESDSDEDSDNNNDNGKDTEL